MKEKRILKIAMIIIVFLIIFIVFIIVTLNSLNSNQLSNGNANLVSIKKDENEDDETVMSETDEIEEEDVYTNSIVLRNLANNNWSRINNYFSSDYEKNEDGNYVYEGYTLCTNNGTYVRNVIFNQEYESEVIAGLKVGANYEKIVEAFGTTPTFENKQLNLYGYKTTAVYAFFYDDEISIYPNTYLSSSNFEKDLFEYLDGDYEGNQTNFVVKIKSNYEDFYAKLDGEDVLLISENRQVQIRLNGNYAETEVTLYNGYQKGTLIQENKENYSNIIEERSIDLVLLVETERILSK